MRVADVGAPAMANMQNMHGVTPDREKDSVHMRLAAVKKLAHLTWKARILRSDSTSRR